VSITHTALAQIQTYGNISSSGRISYPRARFGVNVQYYIQAEVDAYFPDLWTLLKYTGAKYIISAPRRTWADEAAAHGVKILFSFGTVWSPSDPMYESVYKDNATMKAHLDMYKIPQYRDHPGIWGYDIAVEPWGLYSFDSRNPDAITMNLIKTLRYGLQYIKTLDPTHPVSLRLNPAGGYYYGWTLPQDIIDRRKAWINYFVDYVDFILYDFYAYTKGGTTGASGTEFWRDEAGFRSLIQQQFDQVLIPASKGKPIVIGETGCPSATIPDGATFTEAQQARYFEIYGEESKRRDIFVSVYKLIDLPSDSKKMGLFNPQNDGTMNIPKVAASRVKDYLSIP